MICGTFSTTGIADGQEDFYYNGYKANQPPPTTVTKVKQADGTWTVTATWPACPADTTTTHDSGNAAAPAAD